LCSEPLQWDASRAREEEHGPSQGPLDGAGGRLARLNAIEYLTKFGYSPEQAYLLLDAAPIEGRFSGVVDVPNSCATLYLPTAIFDFDVRPSAEGPQRADRGSAAS
jgi:formamidase